MMSVKNSNTCAMRYYHGTGGQREEMGITDWTGKKMGIKPGCTWEREWE